MIVYKWQKVSHNIAGTVYETTHEIILKYTSDRLSDLYQEEPKEINVIRLMGIVFCSS